MASFKLLPVGIWMLASFSAAPALADPLSAPAPIDPAWQVDVGPGRCTLNRPLANGDLGALAVQTWTGEDSYTIGITAKTLSSFPEGGVFQLKMKLGSGEFTQHPARVSALGNGEGKILTVLAVGDDLIDSLSHASEMTIGYGKATIGPVDLPQTQLAVAALRKCVAGQLVDWGADPGQFEPGGAPPVALTDRDDWIPNAKLLSMHFDGRALDALFKVDVAADGTVSGCARIDSQSQDNVEKIACEAVMSRRLFRPAHDARGVAVRGEAAFRVMLIGVERSSRLP